MTGTNTVRTIRVVVDSSGAQQGAQQANSALASIGSTARSSSSDLNSIAQQFVQSGNAAQTMAQQMAPANQNLGLVTQNANNAATAMNSAGSSAGSARASLMELGHVVTSLSGSLMAGANPLRAFAMEVPRIAQAAATGGGGLKMLALQLLQMAGILKITRSATLAAAAASAAASLASVQGAVQTAEANILAADTELALAQAQVRLASTATTAAAAQLRLAAANGAVLAASAEAAIAQSALAQAQADASAAAAASNAATSTSLGAMGAVLGIATIGAVLLAAALSSVKNEAGSDAEMKQFAGTLGLTHEEMKKLKDVTITWGDTFAGVSDVILARAGLSTSQIKTFWSDTWSSIGDFAWFSAGVILGAFAAIVGGLASAIINLAKMVANAVTGAANFAIEKFENMVNTIIGSLNNVAGFMGKVFHTDLGTISAIKLPRVEGKFDLTNPLNDMKNQFNKTFNDVTVKGRAAVAKAARGHAEDRLSDQARQIIDDRNPHKEKKGPKEKEDPMLKAIENVRKYQSELLQANTALAVQNSIWERINAGEAGAFKLLADAKREEIEHVAVLANRQKWGEQWDKLTQAQKSAQDAIAKKIADQGIDVKAVAEVEQRRAAEIEKAKEGHAQIKAALAGTLTQSRQILANDQARQAVEKETLALAVLGKDPTNTWALNRIAAAEAAAREAASTQDILADIAAVNGLKDKYEPRGKVNRDHDNLLAQIASVTNAKVKDANGDPAVIAAARAEQDKLIGYADQQWKEEIQKLAQTYYDNFANAINDLASVFGGTFGKALNQLASIVENIGKGSSGQGGILGAISKLFGGPEGNRSPFGANVDKGFTDFFSADTMKQVFSDPMKSMSSSFSNFTSSFSGPGGITAGIGKAVGGAMGGAAIGQAITPFAKMIWGKFSSTGSQIGGALGGAIFGPIGSIIGSIGGGIIGGLFKKTPKATANVGLDQLTGQFSVGKVSGSKKLLEQAHQFAQGIADSVNGIAQALGGQLQGIYDETIKLKKSKYYVNGVKFKNEDDAQFYAVQQALIHTLTAVSDFTKRVVAAANKSNLNSVVQVASQYEQVLEGLAEMNGGFGNAVTEVVTQMERLKTAMTSLGATTEEIGNVNQYEQLKLKEILDQQLSTLRDLQTFLGGDASGKTDYTRLKEDMTKFGGFKADIAAGKEIDQDAFSALVREISQLAGNVYGTASPQYQDIIKQLNDVVSKAITQVTTQYNDAVAAANATIISNQQTQIGLLQQIANNTGGGSGTTTGTYSGGGGGGGTINGSTMVNYY